MASPLETLVHDLPVGATHQQAQTTKAGQVFFLVAVALCSLLIVDCLIFVALEKGRLRGTDFVLLPLAMVYLLLAWRRPERAWSWSVPLAAVGILAFLLEGVLSLANPSSHVFPWYVWPPGIEREMKPVDLAGLSPVSHFRTNSMGLRGPEFSEHDRLRILCVGGSTTECIYLDETKTWARLLGDALSKDQDGVWVGNAGRSGLMTPDHVLYLTHAPAAAQADIWIVLTGYNDLHYQFMNKYSEFARSSWDRTFVYRRPGLAPPLRRPFHRNLRLVQSLEDVRLVIERQVLGQKEGAFQDQRGDWVRERRRERAAAVIAADLPPLHEALEEYRKQLHALVDLGKAKNKRLVLLTQPTIFTDPTPTEIEELTIGGRLPDGRFLANRLRRQAMDQYNQALRAVAAERDVLCVDLARGLPASTAAFYDDCHFNEGGARLVADQVAQAFRTTKIAPQKSP